MKERRLKFLGLLKKGGTAKHGDALMESLEEMALIIVSAPPLSGETKRRIKKAETLGVMILDEEFTAQELGEALGQGPVPIVGIKGRKAKDAYLNK